MSAAQRNARGRTDIVIKIKNGVAVLTGQAATREEQQQAGLAASRVAGVDRVYNLVMLPA